MIRIALVSIFLLLNAALGRASDREAPQATTIAWKEEGNRDRIAIYSRSRMGSAVLEFKSVGTIDAPSSAVFAVLNNPEGYPEFMPYTQECRVLTRSPACTVAYQRLELPLVEDRDYTLRSENFKKAGPNGPIYRIKWKPANDLGPAEKPGVIRVKVCEGGWLIEPDGAGGTRATYLIYTDSGGAIPAAIANTGSRMAIRKIFAAIRKEVHEPRYATPQG